MNQSGNDYQIDMTIFFMMDLQTIKDHPSLLYSLLWTIVPLRKKNALLLPVTVLALIFKQCRRIWTSLELINRQFHLQSLRLLWDQLKIVESGPTNATLLQSYLLSELLVGGLKGEDALVELSQLLLSLAHTWLQFNNDRLNLEWTAIWN